MTLGATQGEQTRVNVKAAADLSNFQHHVVQTAGERLVNLGASATNAASAAPLGFLQTKPQSGNACAVSVMGETKAVAGAAVGLNRMVTTNASGRVIVANSGDWAVGRALQAAAADGDVITVLGVPAHRHFGVN